MPAPAIPHNADAEASVLGGLLLRNDAIEAVRILAPEDFYDLRHKEVFAAVLRLDARGKPFDPITIEEEINRVGKMAAVGGLGFLSDLMDAVPTADNVAHYAGIVKEHSRRRALITTLSELAHRAHDTTKSLAELASDAQRAATASAEPDAAAPPPTITQILSSDGFKQPQRVYPTPWLALNALLGGGFRSRQVAALAAAAGVGKTGWAISLALQYARAGTPVLIVSTEIDAAEVAARAAAQLLGKTAADILELRVDPKQAAETAAGLPVFVLELDVLDVPGAAPLAAIDDQAQRVKVVAGQVPIIVVDYLQHLATDDAEHRRVNVSSVANGLRKLSQRLDTAVVTVSSVSRPYYGIGRQQMKGEDDPRSWLAAAKESGDIEYACAVVMVLEVASTFTPDGAAAARLIVAKSRRGQPGFVGLRFHGPTGTFAESGASLESMSSQAKRAEKVALEDERVFEKLRTWVGDPPSSKKLRDALGMSGETIGPMLRRLIDAGRIEEIPGKRKDWTVLRVARGTHRDSSGLSGTVPVRAGVMGMSGTLPIRESRSLHCPGDLIPSEVAMEDEASVPMASAHPEDV